MNEKTKNALLSIVASLVCIVIGLLVGFIILYCINAENAVDGFTRIIKGGFYLKPKGIGSEIAQSAPLIMTGLSVAFAFKTGLFNIGAAGQYTVGVFGALYFAIILHMPWYVCLLAAMVCGAIWGAVPGIFKAYFNVNEVITSIMFNWIGLYLVNELMYNTIPGMYDQKTTRTYKLSSASPKSLIPDCGMNSIFRTSSTTIAIFIAIAIAVIIYIVLNKTTFGYELKACGFNKDAAKYAGINEKRNVVLSTIAALQHVPADPILRWTMLLHDIAKPACRTTDEAGIDHFKGHAPAGEKMAKAILRRLKFDNETIRQVAALIRWHDCRMAPEKPVIRRILNKLSPELFEKLMIVQEADTMAKSLYQREKTLERIGKVRECVREILDNGDCFTLKTLAVSGKDLMEFGVPKGPKIGECLNAALEEVMKDPAKNTKEYLTEYVKTLL